MDILTQPTLLLKPFAESGDKNSIPVTNTDASNPQLADLTNGFPQVVSEDPDDGGLPPERKDINGLGYLTTTYDYFYQAGGTFTFNPTISSAIGGYPLGARLWYTDGNGATTVVRSTVANNTDNFNDGSATGIGTTWAPEIPVLSWNNTWTGDNTFSGNTTYTGYSTTFSVDTYSGLSDNGNQIWMRTYNSTSSSNGVGFANSNNQYLGSIQGVTTNNGSTTDIVISAVQAGTNTASNLYVGVNNGTKYVTIPEGSTVNIPTPASSIENSYQSANTAWVHKYISALNTGNFSLTRIDAMGGPNPIYDIDLTEPYTNYDGIIIVVTNDSSNGVDHIFVPTWKLNLNINWVNVNNVPSFMLFQGVYYWSVLRGSTTTKFLHNNDNCIIQGIWGVKF